MSSLHRNLSGERRIHNDIVRKALQHLTREEFESIVSDWDTLRALGIIRYDGVADYGLALKILALASRDEYLKNAILRFVVQEFRDDLRKMLGISFAGITTPINGLEMSLDITSDTSTTSVGSGPKPTAG